MSTFAPRPVDLSSIPVVPGDTTQPPTPVAQPRPIVPAVAEDSRLVSSSKPATDAVRLDQLANAALAAAGKISKIPFTAIEYISAVVSGGAGEDAFSQPFAMLGAVGQLASWLLRGDGPRNLFLDTAVDRTRDRDVATSTAGAPSVPEGSVGLPVVGPSGDATATPSDEEDAKLDSLYDHCVTASSIANVLVPKGRRRHYSRRAVAELRSLCLQYDPGTADGKVSPATPPLSSRTQASRVSGSPYRQRVVRESLLALREWAVAIADYYLALEEQSAAVSSTDNFTAIVAREAPRSLMVLRQDIDGPTPTVLAPMRKTVRPGTSIAHSELPPSERGSPHELLGAGESGSPKQSRDTSPLFTPRETFRIPKLIIVALLKEEAARRCVVELDEQSRRCRLLEGAYRGISLLAQARYRAVGETDRHPTISTATATEGGAGPPSERLSVTLPVEVEEGDARAQLALGEAAARSLRFTTALSDFLSSEAALDSAESVRSSEAELRHQIEAEESAELTAHFSAALQTVLALPARRPTDEVQDGNKARKAVKTSSGTSPSQPSSPDVQKEIELLRRDLEDAVSREAAGRSRVRQLEELLAAAPRNEAQLQRRITQLETEVEEGGERLAAQKRVVDKKLRELMLYAEAAAEAKARAEQLQRSVDRLTAEMEQAQRKRESSTLSRREGTAPATPAHAVEVVSIPTPPEARRTPTPSSRISRDEYPPSTQPATELSGSSVGEWLSEAITLASRGPSRANSFRSASLPATPPEQPLRTRPHDAQRLPPPPLDNPLLPPSGAAPLSRASGSALRTPTVHADVDSACTTTDASSAFVARIRSRRTPPSEP